MLFLCISLIVVSSILASDIKPVLYDLGPVPALTGNLEKNFILTKAERFKLNQVVGPASFAFHRDHVYTGLANGQIVDVSNCGVKRIASLGPPKCNGELQCGRIVGLRMDNLGRLVVADAHRGIFRINVETGAVQTLYSSRTPVGGRVTKFISDVVVAQDGTILFTDSSARWPRQEKFSILLEGDSTGRLLAYSDKSNTAIVVWQGLSFPNGLQLGPNDDYLLIAETGRAKILKLGLKTNDPSWLKMSVFARGLPGLPDNIRASGRGTYWVAFSQARHQNMSSMVDDYADDLQMRKIIAKVYSKDQIKSMTDKYGIVAELDQNGNIIRTLQDPTGLKVDAVSEAHEHEGYLYMGAHDKNFISRVITTKQFNVERFLTKIKSTCRATQINVERLRVVLRRMLAIAELRRTLLEAKRRREEAERARQSTTAAPPPSDSTASVVSTTATTAVFATGETTASSTSLTDTTQAATATTQEGTTGGSDGTTSASESTAAVTTSEATTAAATTATATTAAPVTAVATESTTIDEESDGGIMDVDATTEAPTTAAQTSAATTSVTDSTAQTATDVTTAAASTAGPTTAATTGDTTAGVTTAASTASQTTDGATTASATSATTDSSATTVSTAATT